MSRITSPLRASRSTFAIAALALASSALLVACAPAAGDARATAAAAAAQVPSVPVALVRATTTTHGATQLAHVEAAQRVELQARVAGPIVAVLFREGELVRAGQPLFQIDPRPYEATLARLRAELLLTRTREATAAGEAERARQLHADRAIATEEFERRVAAHAEAQARRAAAEAAAQAAQLDLEFTLVRAPIGGRAGRALVTAGNFVAAGSNPTALASIVATTPLHVHFDVADRRLLDRAADERNTKAWTARILDTDGRELAQAPIDFVDHSIDAATGTLRLRARVDTPGRALMPGQYVRVQVTTGAAEAALTVPDQAVGTDQGRRFVLVVGAEGKVEYRPVDLGALHEGQRIVVQGLKVGEQVIVSGLMRVRPGMTVKPQSADDAARSAAAPTPGRS